MRGGAGKGRRHASNSLWKQRCSHGKKDVHQEKPCTDHGTQMVTEYGKRLADTDLFEGGNKSCVARELVGEPKLKSQREG